MRHCKYCEHGIFDERWGEWKCKKFELRVYDPYKTASKCEKFKGKSAIATVQTKFYDILKAECGEMDAIYKDYICHLVGIIGLNALISQNLVEACGVVEGRQLYVLCKRGS